MPPASPPALASWTAVLKALMRPGAIANDDLTVFTAFQIRPTLLLTFPPLRWVELGRTEMVKNQTDATFNVIDVQPVN